MKKYFVKDLNTIKRVPSLDIAMETANYWMELQKQLVEDADDDTLTRWMRSPDMGLESGDVQIFEVEIQEKDWEYLVEEYSELDFCNRTFCEHAINNEKPIKVLSGKQQVIEEFERRGLTMEGNYND